MFRCKENREFGAQFELGDLNNERIDGRVWRNCNLPFVGKCNCEVVSTDMDTVYWRVRWIRY